MDLRLQQKILKYQQVRKYYVEDGYTIDEACKKVKINKTTFYNYRKLLKENNLLEIVETNNNINNILSSEVLNKKKIQSKKTTPKKKSTKKVVKTSKKSKPRVYDDLFTEKRDSDDEEYIKETVNQSFEIPRLTESSEDELEEIDVNADVEDQYGGNQLFMSVSEMPTKRNNQLNLIDKYRKKRDGIN
ncbi:putative IS3 family transposase A protein [Sputnik virophage 3]|uniref:Transposase A protein n=2 Tax=Mimivirus-dependent virus Sputnik TaxID=1932927 RepID=I0CEQ8_9VIRU|nr:putative IS3 family transposase A protein [Sputnik virophage 2]AFH75291.1 putative IS3 family transposase A protein [Sputnik virophage 3]AUG85004.1 transposase A protein [Sputnik virophage 2]UMZ08529.1 DNA binding domain-containing protein [Mimivirus-dependent virus Sputnik]